MHHPRYALVVYRLPHAPYWRGARRATPAQPPPRHTALGRLHLRLRCSPMTHKRFAAALPHPATSPLLHRYAPPATPLFYHFHFRRCCTLFAAPGTHLRGTWAVRRAARVLGLKRPACPHCPLVSPCHARSLPDHYTSGPGSVRGTDAHFFYPRHLRRAGRHCYHTPPHHRAPHFTSVSTYVDRGACRGAHHQRHHIA